MPSPRPPSRSPCCRHLHLLLHLLVLLLLLLLLHAPAPARAVATDPSLPHTQRNLPSPALVKRLLVNTRYEFMDGQPFGCSRGGISHLKDIDTNVNLPMLASVPFSSIKIGRSSCSEKRDDNRMDVYSIGYVIRELKNIAGLPPPARNAIDIAGLDLSLRVCGSQKEAQALQYFFTTRFDDLYDYLVDRFLPRDPRIVKSLQAVAAAAAAANDDTTTSSDINSDDPTSTDLDEETLLLMGNATYAWMVSTPQKDDGSSFRVCVYRALIPKENSTLTESKLPKPTRSPSPSPVYTPEEDVDVSPSPEPVEDVPTPEPTPTPTPTPVADKSATATPSPKRQSTFSDSTFGQATNSADGTEGGDSQKASAAACFPAHARVRMADAAGKRGEGREVQMDQVKAGDDTLMGGKVFGFTHRDAWAWTQFVTLTTASNHTLTVSPGHYVYVAEHEHEQQQQLQQAQAQCQQKQQQQQQPTHEQPQQQEQEQSCYDARRETRHAGVLDTGRIGRRATMTIRTTAGRATMIAARRMRAGMRLVTADGGVTTVERVGRTWARGLYNPQTTDGSIVVDGVVVSTYTEAVGPPSAHALLTPVRALFKWAGVAVSYGLGGQHSSSSAAGATVDMMDGLGVAVKHRRWRPSSASRSTASTWSWRR